MSNLKIDSLAKTQVTEGKGSKLVIQNFFCEKNAVEYFLYSL